MLALRTRLVPGEKPPYEHWTFIDLPPAEARALGPCPLPVRGTVDGAAFQSTLHRSRGGSGADRYRVIVRKEDLPAGVGIGSEVDVTVEADPVPRAVVIPPELAAVLDGDPELAAGFAALAPSMRRAWAEYVGGAKQAATRAARAERANTGIRAKGWPK